MKKILIFSILLLSAIAVTMGTTITTTMQIQPAYSQVSHCLDARDTSTCVTPGQNPTVTVNGVPTPNQPTHQEAGQIIGGCHVQAAKGIAECTVEHP
jgi:hypothetical protein